MVLARRWQRRHLPGRCKDRGRGASRYENTAPREGTVDGSRVHSRRTVNAAEGIDGPRSAAVTLLAIALLQEREPLEGDDHDQVKDYRDRHDWEDGQRRRHRNSAFS